MTDFGGVFMPTYSAVNLSRREILQGEWLVIVRGFEMNVIGFVAVNGFIDLSNGGYIRVN